VYAAVRLPNKTHRLSSTSESVLAKLEEGEGEGEGEGEEGKEGE
jgi:hypothetical protein